MNLYEIITVVKTLQGSKEKTAYLMQHKDNELLKMYLKAVNDPSLSYYIAEAPEPTTSGNIEFSETIIANVIHKLAERRITGNAAREWLGKVMDMLNSEGQELLRLLIDRKVGDSVGDTMILKVFPDLYLVPAYMRCGLITPEIKASFDKEESFYIQTKMDGSFFYLIKQANGDVEGMTRAGSKYPSWMVDRIATGVPAGYVIAGEMLVYKDGILLDRKTGNGIINSILSGDIETDDHKQYTFSVTAWNVLTIDEFRNKESKRDYSERFEQLKEIIKSTNNITIVDTWEVKSINEAYRIYGEHLIDNKEGNIIKKKTSKWKNNTSKDEIKLKLSFEFEVEITSYYEGEGKNAGMLGGVGIKSSDGLLQSNVGSGFDDAERIYLWSLGDYLIGKIITIKANDIITNVNDSTLSLNLPIFLATRFTDKKEADSLERILAQKEAAKAGFPKLV